MWGSLHVIQVHFPRCPWYCRLGSFPGAVYVCFIKQWSIITVVVEQTYPLSLNLRSCSWVRVSSQYINFFCCNCQVIILSFVNNNLNCKTRNIKAPKNVGSYYFYSNKFSYFDGIFVFVLTAIIVRLYYFYICYLYIFVLLWDKSFVCANFNVLHSLSLWHPSVLCNFVFSLKGSLRWKKENFYRAAIYYDNFFRVTWRK